MRLHRRLPPSSAGRWASPIWICISRQKVTVFKQRRAKNPKLGSSRTPPNGRYSLKEKNAKGKFYAEVKQTSISSGTCLAAESETVKVG